jgi:ABC-type oligopeptide transport system substrate-binding subunit
MKIFLLFAALALAENAPLKVQLSAEPNTLDPYHVSDVLGFNLISNVAEGLLRLDGKGELKNGLAESYKISKDGRTYRFRLRKGAKWSDGKPVEIDELVAGFRHALDPKTAARDASLLASVKEVRKEKDEFVIELKEPDSSLLQVITMPLAAPLRKENLGPRGEWKAESPSTGAYRISSYKPDREIRLEPNPHYGGAALALVFRVIPEETTALNLFETGGLDILTTVPGTEIPRLQKQGLLEKSAGAGAFYLAFNLTKEPFADVRWRKALAASLNRESLAKVQPGTLDPVRSYLPSAIEGSRDSKPDFRNEKEWAAQQAKPKISLVYPSTALGGLVMQRIQADLKGWDIKLEPMEWKAYLGRLQGEAPPLFYMGYSAPFNDPMSHLKLFLSTEPDNRSRYQNAKYDSLVEKVRHERGAARVKAAEAAQRLLVEEDAAVIPLLSRPQLHGVAKGIKGFRVNPFGVVDFRELRR